VGRRVFLTGGTGFIGRHVLAELESDPSNRVQCLTRRPSAAFGEGTGSDVIVGDLREPASYSAALRETDVVLHLAAATGSARMSDYFAINLDGTRALLAAARAAGVRKFVFVSSIAATYVDKTAYYYAQSKQLAEQAVRESGLNHLIVRPTLVLGRRSPILKKLVALARLPIMPVFGDGSVRVQPVCVDDVAVFLASTTEDSTLPDAAVDLGGTDVVTFEELMRRLRMALIGRDSPVVHVPVRPLMVLLGWAERWLPPILPVTAGQFAAFVNDSIAALDPSVAARVPHMKSLDDMLQRATLHD